MDIPQGLFLCHSFGAGAEFNPFAAPLHGISLAAGAFFLGAEMRLFCCHFLGSEKRGKQYSRNCSVDSKTILLDYIRKIQVMIQ